MRVRSDGHERHATPINRWLDTLARIDAKVKRKAASLVAMGVVPPSQVETIERALTAAHIQGIVVGAVIDHAERKERWSRVSTYALDPLVRFIKRSSRGCTPGQQAHALNLVAYLRGRCQ